MQNQQLIEYIKKQQELGVSVNDIRDSLLKQSWTKEDIDSAMSSLSSNNVPTPRKKRSLLFWRKDKVENGAYAPYEEIDSKKTSRLGYFFLVLMVFFGVTQGNAFLGALERSIDRPESNSPCLATLFSYTNKNYYPTSSSYYGGYRGDQGGCSFSRREIDLGVKKLFDEVSPTITAIRAADSNISSLNNQISSKQYNRNQTVSDYEISLLEGIANINGTAFDRAKLKSGVISADEQLAYLRAALAKEESRKSALVSSVKSIVNPRVQVLEQANNDYAHDLAVYQFEQFALSFLFIAPIFYFLWRRYHASKSARSEYAIIWGGMLATVSIIFAQIILVFIYQILPREIIQKVFAILAQIKFLWAILYWLGFILIPLFFGVLIYLIQKKFYNKQAVLMRALKSGHCPQCSLNIIPTMNNCPVCGYKLKTKCASCGQMSTSGGAYCDSCGVKRSLV